MIALLLAALALPAAAGQDCADPERSQAPAHFNSDHHYSLSAAQMEQAFETHLRSGKRMPHRAWLQDGRYMAGLYKQRLKHPYERVDAVELPEALLTAMSRHLSQAFERGWARHPFMWDMGHGHLMLPTADYERLRAEIPDHGQRQRAYYRHPKLALLYHAAENLIYDPPLADEEAFRRHHRNIVGTVAAGEIRNTFARERKVNTAGAPDGHVEAGGIVYVTGGSSGCFPFVYRGRTIYLDFAVYATPPDPDGEDDGL